VGDHAQGTYGAEDRDAKGVERDEEWDADRKVGQWSGLYM